jgi:hypothetical protein
MKYRISLGVSLLGIASFVLSFIASADDSPRPVDFNRDIRPILSDNCFTCHGPDDKQRMAQLRFDTREGAFAKSGVIVPGNAQTSRLIERVTARDPLLRMPPVDSGHKLTENQIALLRRWIDEGAKWEIHWAYLPPVRPPLPQVKNTSWTRNPIDNFILARLERERLAPSPEASKETLLRRATLDLTGLPPTLEEMDSFLADQSPDAYEKRIDKLLRSPHYGERMAMQWLDLARYADTHGYHIDSHRDMWPWRDWLITAFNRNLPFDQFTIEQLAGDLLPDATTDQKIATGFNRNHMINFEGGAIPEEYQVEYVVDRVETTANVWMGMTLGCARCHSHKYDPISQKEFYQFFAFFNTVSEQGLDGRTGNAEPMLRLETDEQKKKLAELRTAINAAEESLSDSRVALLQQEWEKAFVAGDAPSLRAGLVAHYELDGSFSDSSGRHLHGRTARGDPSFASTSLGRSVGLDGDTQISFAGAGSFDASDAFTLALWINPSSNVPLTLLHKLEDAQSRRGYEMVIDDVGLIGVQKYDGRLTVRLAGDSKSAIEVRARQRLPMSSWHHIALAYDGAGKAAGLKLYINGKPTDVEITQDNLTGSIKTSADLEVGNKLFGRPFKGQLDDLRIYDRALDDAEIEELGIRHPVRKIISGVYGKRTAESAARVKNYFLTHDAPAEMRDQYAELKKLKQRKEEIERSVLTAMVMSEMEKPRETFVLGRGDYRNKTEKVLPGVPSILPPLAKDAPLNRLTLARWLISPSHPLTARVAVNRYWQMYFGHGIVKTSEDFGSQGEPPAHRELLDWLATEFMQTGWDIRALQRLIVTSAAYRQSSKATPEMIEKDPENRLLARGPRLRLPAETVRDNALAISGLLEKRIGGPGFFPYQPKGLWEEMAFGDGFSAQIYAESKGRDLYRRSMYTFWKRTVPPPSLAAFDAPDREKCASRRPMTNTPLQALVLMNDPTFVEAARSLAQRALTEGGNSVETKIAYAFRLSTGRKPSVQEARALRELLTAQTARYRRDEKSAMELLRVGESKWNEKLDAKELAAWIIVASAILNLDETITKE